MVGTETAALPRTRRRPDRSARARDHRLSCELARCGAEVGRGGEETVPVPASSCSTGPERCWSVPAVSGGPVPVSGRHEAAVGERRLPRRRGEGGRSGVGVALIMGSGWEEHDLLLCRVRTESCDRF